nr:substrate-binding domain-containing protein [uncultured Draconibacterium sp.]
MLPQPPSEEGYWAKPIKGIHKRISELPQYGLQIESFTFNQFSSESFVDAANKVLELKPDGVVLAPFFKKEASVFIEELKELEIPFVFIDSDLKEMGQLSYIGQNSYQSGLVSGKLLDLMVAKGNILVIHFAKEMDNQNHLVQREKGFYEWFKNKKGNDHQLFTIEIPNTDSDEWMEALEKDITSKNIQGIFVTNSKVFNVGQLLQKYKLEHIKVIGHDLIKENVEFLKKDMVQFLICQRPEDQGYNAVNKLFRSVVQKREIQKESYTPIDIITKENVDYYKEFK